MATPGIIQQLSNPFTPLAFLPPALAYETMIANYLLAGVCAVFIWDLLNNVAGDFRLLFKNKVGLPTIVYFVSRFGALGCTLAGTIFATSPVGAGKCIPTQKIFGAFYPLSIAPTSLLFFFRVRAVFDRNKYVVSFFFFLWLAVLAGALSVVTAISSENIGPSDYCVVTGLKSYASAAVIIPLIHDTFVFLAISWRLAGNSHMDLNVGGQLKIFMFGEYLPAFSRALLQDGQMYYLITVISNLLVVAMVFASSVPVTYRSMFSIPNIMLTNIMACRVFRNTKFGVYRGTDISTTRTTMERDERDGQGIRLSKRPRTIPLFRKDLDTTLAGTEMESADMTKVVIE